MLSDLALIYQNFYEPLPGMQYSGTFCMLGTEKCLMLCVCTATYSQFKARLHQLFPVVVDTKNLCFAVQRVRHKAAFSHKNLS